MEDHTVYGLREEEQCKLACLETLENTTEIKLNNWTKVGKTNLEIALECINILFYTDHILKAN